MKRKFAKLSSVIIAFKQKSTILWWLTVKPYGRAKKSKPSNVSWEIGMLTRRSPINLTRRF
ncbi:Uncharacterised protein [Vibrio cholerae]|nr:Uncharacterised protein [Vibrio cholerae]